MKHPHTPPVHQPDMLYIGCVDARLDPIDDLGIRKGMALIKRDIAALVTPGNRSLGATLEFFLNHLPEKPGKPKHIVISGHTDCGGLKACRHHACGERDHYLPLYLEELEDVRAAVMDKAEKLGWNEARILQELEKESIKQSIVHLQTYPAVQRALAENRLVIHGWLLDTATQEINVLNAKIDQFERMTPAYARATGLEARVRGISY